MTTTRDGRQGVGRRRADSVSANRSRAGAEHLLILAFAGREPLFEAGTVDVASRTAPDCNGYEGRFGSCVTIADAR
jgi:hypothetical protein